MEEDPYAHVRLDEKDYRQFMHYNKYYDHFTEVLEKTNYEKTPWDILFVDGKKDTSRKALTICVERLEEFIEKDTTRDDPHLPILDEAVLPLAQVNLTEDISDEEYDERLEDLQQRAGDLMYQVYLENKAVIVAYEGTDAAGKGGNIERLTRYIDPRSFDVATVSGPTKHELSHHYLWRFYRDFPVDGRMTIFDRSWYGRVLVERIEELTPSYRWKEAYGEINQMEHNLVHEGYLILKYLIIIDKEEQLERFEARAEDPEVGTGTQFQQYISFPYEGTRTGGPCKDDAPDGNKNPYRRSLFALRGTGGGVRIRHGGGIQHVPVHGHIRHASVHNPHNGQ